MPWIKKAEEESFRPYGATAVQIAGQIYADMDSEDKQLLFKYYEMGEYISALNLVHNFAKNLKYKLSPGMDDNFWGGVAVLVAEYIVKPETFRFLPNVQKSKLPEFSLENLQELSPKQKEDAVNKLLEQYQSASEEQKPILEKRIMELNAILLSDRLIKQASCKHHLIKRANDIKCSFCFYKVADNFSMYQEVAKEIFEQLNPMQKERLVKALDKSNNVDFSRGFEEALIILNPYLSQLPKENNQFIGDVVLTVCELAAIEKDRQNIPEQIGEMTSWDIRNTLPEAKPKEREIKIDKLLDQYNATDNPELRKNLEYQIRELQSSLYFGYVKRGWLISAATLFSPSNPPPFPEPGTRSGLWGYVELNNDPSSDDYDEMLFLVNNTYNLYNKLWNSNLSFRRLSEEGFHNKHVRDFPDLVNFLKQNFEAINREYVYPTMEGFVVKEVPEVVEKLKELYKSNPHLGEEQLARFMSQFDEDDLEDLEDQLGQDPDTAFLRFFEDALNAATGKSSKRPSPKSKTHVEDVLNRPGIEPEQLESQKNALLDAFNLGTISQEELEEELRELQRMGYVK